MTASVTRIMGALSLAAFACTRDPQAPSASGAAEDDTATFFSPSSTTDAWSDLICGDAPNKSGVDLRCYGGDVAGSADCVGCALPSDSDVTLYWVTDVDGEKQTAPCATARVHDGDEYSFPDVAPGYFYEIRYVGAVQTATKGSCASELTYAPAFGLCTDGVLHVGEMTIAPACD